MPNTFADFRRQWPQEVFGVCTQNAPSIANYCNRATQRLMHAPEQPHTGWFGTVVPMVFNVQQSFPFVTTPRGIARIAFMDVCRRPVLVRNRFFEYLWAGAGIRLNRDGCATGTRWLGNGCDSDSVDRGFHPLFTDLPAGPQYLRATPTDNRDKGKRLLIQTFDQNGLKFYSQDVDIQVEGFFLSLEFPFATSPFLVTGPVYGVQKDVTYGDVILAAVDPTTGIETQLARYEPGETRPEYRRYRVRDLPGWCRMGACSAPTQLIQVEVLAKRDYYPVAVDTDWLLIGNIEALVLECQSIRHSGMDTPIAKQESELEHTEAVRLLRGELDHYEGKEDVAVNVAPFGTAQLGRQRIGTMI